MMLRLLLPTALLALGVFFGSAPGSTASDDVSHAPNILLIVADDLGWNDLGYQGSEIRTPRIDELANAGIRFDRFYAQPSCSPTRAALMTGKSSLRLGVVRPMSKLNPTGLPLDHRIAPQYLKDAGYQTALVGKWHLGFRERAYGPVARGFDHFYGHLTGGIGYWDHVHGGALDWQRNGETLREDGYATRLIADEAIRVIEERDTARPLFLYAAFNAPHLPNEAPTDAIEAYSELPDRRRRIHAAMVSELDASVGRIVDTLEREGILENTLVWFMSDNGGLNSSSFPPWLVSVARLFDRWYGDEPIPITALEFGRVNALDGAADNTPLRKGKQSVYEGGVRVPAFVYWRGRLEQRMLTDMVTVQDVLPTLLSVAGVESSDRGFDGVDRWPTLADGTATEASEHAVKSMEGEALIAYPWKLIDLGSGHLELYNIEDDPAERSDLSDREPARVAAMSATLEAASRGESIHVPVYKSLFDMDFFGGDEVDPPYSEIVE